MSHLARNLQAQHPWIDAFTDQHADLQTFSSCLALADLNADDDHKLILVDFGNGTHIKLKVYRGTALATELPLLSPPVAIRALYTDKNDPRIPGVAVATGSHVLVYRNCRPYFKFSLPSEDCSCLEADIWHEKGSTSQLVSLLEELSVELGFTNLSPLSQNLLVTEPAQRDDFIQKHSSLIIKKQATITCVASLNKNIGDETDVSCLLLATESAQLFVMDPEIFTVIDSFALPDVACSLTSSGVFMVDYRIVFACRNGGLHSLRSGNIRYLTQLSSLPVSVLLVSQSVVIASMDSLLHSYTPKGRKQWSVSLPGDVVCMSLMPLVSLALNLVAVALHNGLLHLYNGPNLVHVLSAQDPISAMTFGKYGKEEHALITVASSGALGIRLLKRTAQFQVGDKSSVVQRSNPHDIKLLIPKKSKLFVEQTLRERQQAKEIHMWFQRSWLGFSVLAGESYVSALRNVTVSKRESLKLTVQVIGLGPRMKIQMVLENMSDKIVPQGLSLTFIYDPKIYYLHKPIIQVPMLVFGYPCSLETLVTCQMPITGVVQVLVISTMVLLTANINMPSSAGILG